MKIKDFLCEQWMTAYEKQAVYNMTDTSFQALSFPTLLALEPAALDDVVLDYGDITGDEALKREILKLYRTGSVEQITCMPGALCANQHVMDALLEAGDHVIAFVPGYQQFYEYPRSLGCEVTTVAYVEEDGWRFPVEKVQEAIRPNTKMIVLASPSNPTGTRLDAADWQALVALCRPRGIYILCDEVYRGLDLERTPSVSDCYERGIATSSLSKIFALPGLRLGWVKANREVIERLNVRRDYTFISTGPLTDRLALAALRHKETILEANRRRLAKNQETLKAWLADNESFSVVLDPLSPVAFLRYEAGIPSTALCRRALRERGIFFVPGSCFEVDQHLRLGMGRDPEAFESGLTEFSIWFNETLKKI